MNRIQNIVVPPRNTLPHLRHAHALRTHTFYPVRARMNARAPPQQTRLSTVRHVLLLLRASLLPLDLSSTLSRTLLRLPSLILLSRSVVVLLVVLLKSAELYPESSGVLWIQNLGAWTDSKDMKLICWQCFVACCAALVTTELTAGLEGRCVLISLSDLSITF